MLSYFCFPPPHTRPHSPSLKQPGPNDYEIVPKSDLVVSRSATKANKSQYYIDGRASNYTEVTTLLKDRGIDLEHKRFLILQVCFSDGSIVHSYFRVRSSPSHK